MKEAYTTGEIARICRVTINTVVKWFENGDIKGYRIPSSKARRVTRKDLIAFLKKYDFPIDEILSDKYKILTIDHRPGILTRFRKAFSDKSTYWLETARSGFEAGLLTRSFMPDVIFINIELADIDVRRISSILKKNKETAETSLVAITPETDDKTVKKLTKLGFDEVVKSNPGEEELLELFGRLLGKN